MGFLIPDPDEMRAAADRINAHAAGARQRASELATMLGGTDWHGLAADVFDTMAHGVLTGLRTAADRLDSAATLLRRHATAVAERLGGLAALGSDLGHLGADLGQTMLDTVARPGGLEQDADSLMDDAGGVVSDGAHLLGFG